jgi:hypothetical protein
MGKCVQCGNDYDKSFEVVMAGQTLTSDSFECAIQALALALIAGCASSATAWSVTARSSAAALCQNSRRHRARRPRLVLCHRLA